jgi:general stress protein YciG
VKKELREYMAKLGAKGGATTGAAKRRDPEFYVKLAAAGVKAREAKARAKKKAGK